MTTDADQNIRNELIEELRRLADEVGRSPTIADLKNASGYPPASRFLDTFGSWNQAKQAADLDTFQKKGCGTSYSRDELLDRLRQLAENTDGLVTKQDVINADSCPSVVTYQRHFGSWNAAKEAAGLETIETEETPVQYTDEELCELLRTLAAESEEPLTIRDVENADGYPDHTTFERRFGSWNKAKEAAGLEPIGKGQGQRGDTYSDTELLQLLRDRADEVDGPLTKADLDQATGYPASSTYARRFGSWQAAQEQARLTPQTRGAQQQYTDEELRASLRKLAATLDRPLTQTDVTQADDLPSVSTFERRFGSWTQAKDAAGLETSKQGEPQN